MTLVTRLIEVIQAIGSDIRALQQRTGGGGIPPSLFGVFPGNTVNQVGTVRYYPRIAIHVTTIVAWLSAPATLAVVAAVRKNGVIIREIVIEAGQSMTTQVVAHDFLPTDYLTMDIISGAGRDLTLRLDY